MNRCTVCSRPDIDTINRALAARVATNAVAATFNVPRISLRRHIGHLATPPEAAPEALEPASAPASAPVSTPGATGRTAVALAQRRVEALRQQMVEAQQTLAQAQQQLVANRQRKIEVLVRGSESEVAALQGEAAALTATIAETEQALPDLTTALQLAERVLEQRLAEREARKRAHWQRVQQQFDWEKSAEQPAWWVAGILASQPGSICQWPWNPGGRPQAEARVAIVQQLEQDWPFIDEECDDE